MNAQDIQQMHQALYGEQLAQDEAEIVAATVNKYAPLIGIAYPDREGRTITILDVDEWGTALLERGGEYWGCKAEYLEHISENGKEQVL